MSPTGGCGIENDDMKVGEEGADFFGDFCGQALRGPEFDGVVVVFGPGAADVVQSGDLLNELGEEPVFGGEVEEEPQGLTYGLFFMFALDGPCG